MSLLWALPVLVLVAGIGTAAFAVDRLTAELAALDRSLRRLNRVGVGVEDLRRELERTERRVQAKVPR